MEVQIAAAVRVRIMPILMRLMADPALDKHRLELELSQQQLKQICTTLQQEDPCSTDALSQTELRKMLRPVQPRKTVTA